MEKRITLIKFTYPSELIAVKGILQSEGIEFYVRDELTAQIHNFVSDAIGGIRLDVKQSDYERAKNLLKESGYLNNQTEKASKFWILVDGLTSKVPVLNKLRLELRLIVGFGVLITTFLFIVFGMIYRSNKVPPPTTAEYLTNGSWCLSYIEFQKKKFAPNTIYEGGIHFKSNVSCNERLYLEKNNFIHIPGFNSKRIEGEWLLHDNVVKIVSSSSHGHIFNGEYEIQKGPLELTLVSETTKIYCYK